jgi:hypothetical protein
MDFGKRSSAGRKGRRKAARGQMGAGIFPGGVFGAPAAKGAGGKAQSDLWPVGKGGARVLRIKKSSGNLAWLIENKSLNMNFQL